MRLSTEPLKRFTLIPHDVYPLQHANYRYMVGDNKLFFEPTILGPIEELRSITEQELEQLRHTFNIVRHGYPDIEYNTVVEKSDEWCCGPSHHLHQWRWQANKPELLMYKAFYRTVEATGNEQLFSPWSMVNDSSYWKIRRLSMFIEAVNVVLASMACENYSRWQVSAVLYDSEFLGVEFKRNRDGIVVSLNTDF